MANGYFERGEMYDILFGDGLSGEMAAHRPGVIVSSDEGNVSCPTVVMVYTTTTTTANKEIGVNHRFVMNGWTNYALCNQFVTVNKNRLKKFYGKLSTYDMDAIDRCIDTALDLVYVDDAAVKEKEQEVAVLNAQITDLKQKIVELESKASSFWEKMGVAQTEAEAWRRAYNMALDLAAEVKLTGDIARRVEQKAEKVVEPAPPVEDKSGENKPELVDINSASFEELRRCGFSSNLVLTIINRRPYRSIEELKNLPGLTSAAYQIVSPKICCVVQQKPKEKLNKVNVNTATAKELYERLGLR